MKGRGLIFTLLLGIPAIAHADDIVTIEGQVYRRVEVSRADPLGIEIMHESGAASVPFSKMTKADRKKYGYDADKEKAFFLQQLEQRVAAQRAARDEARRREEERVRQERQRAQQMAEQERQRAQQLAEQERQREQQQLVQWERERAEAVARQKARRALFKPSNISVAAFHATRPTSATVFLAEAHLSDYFNYDFSEGRNAYWSVDLRTRDGTDIGNGYIRKNERGAALFALIEDGEWHSILAEVAYPARSDDSSVFYLLDYLAAPSSPASADDARE